MSKRPRTEPPTNGQEDIWGDDFTYDEVNSIVNIESLASQSHFSVNLNNPGNQRDSQIREGEIKNLKNKIKQLEIQLYNTKQEQDDKFKALKNIIDCKDTELKFQQQETTALKNKIKEMKIINKIVPQKNVSFSCMKTGSNSTLLHNASEHNTKKNVSTQTFQITNNEHYLLIRDNFPEINKSYEKLKKCLYPDLFSIQNNQNDVKNLSTIQDCHLILAKLMVLETFDEIQSYSLIELLFENCKHILESTIEILQETIDDEDFVKREKQLIYSYLHLNKQCLKNRFSMFDLQFSHLLDCISVLTTISNVVPRIVMNHTNNLFQTFVHFLQIIGSQSRTLEYVSVIIALIKFLTNLCSCNWNITKQKQLDIYDIIKEIVFCRPCINIVQELINLLSKISIYTEITDSLCQLSTPNTFILSDRVSTFTTGTCVLRVLCLQLELLKHSNHLITNYLYFVNVLLNSTHVPRWMHKIPNKTCDCTASFIELTIQFLYIVFNIYEKERESYDIDLLKLMEEIVENSYSILYRLGKLDEEFRSHISKCKGRYDVIVRKIQKLEFGKSNTFLVKELKKFEFKSLTHSQYSSSVIYEVFPIDKPKFTQKSQYQFDEPNKQISENNVWNN
ncbi:uncharacterized protein LOC132952541 isoform X1 [Metopolophium dirhodum]|uniref:uncharacterized protein LOC132952541 isoform X1 n=2 Tax=Metopolophium dirhodum TaxID=44670 RepID=UPI00298FB4E3|nr:uncharacterized protein LOC132952541 isoform X1 [Metopolophium dirhodum]